MRNFQKFLVVFGTISLFISGTLLFQRNSTGRLKFDNYDSQTYSDTGSDVWKPKYLTIGDLGINLPIITSVYDGKKWQTTRQGVSYLANTPLPGKIGNSIFYGHNSRSLLGNLIDAHPGQEINVVMDTGFVERFKISYVQIVRPDQVSILDQTEDARLTIYTCTGFLDTKRLVVVANKV